jgi:hypothetical protein
VLTRLGVDEAALAEKEKMAKENVHVICGTV